MLPQYPEHLKLASTPTEFRPLDRISEELGGPRIWIKHDDLTGSVVSGNKIRKLEFLIAEAQRDGARVLMTCGGLQSNHCRATAITAARLGMRCHLLLRGPDRLEEQEQSYSLSEVCEKEGFDGNILLDVLSGASISIYSPKYYSENLETEFSTLEAVYAGRGFSSYSIPTGGSNATGLWGYLRAAEELANDFRRENINPTAIYCATGSGGTQGGLSLGFHYLDKKVKVVGVAVCDSEEYFYNKIRGDVEAWRLKYQSGDANLVDQLQINTIDSYIGPGYALGYPALFKTIENLARLEGVVLDPVYTGKAFFGLVEEIKKGRFNASRDVVFIHTGGVFGLFPFKNYFTDTVEK